MTENSVKEHGNVIISILPNGNYVVFLGRMMLDIMCKEVWKMH